MPRDLPLANGRMLVNFDANYDLRDIYWPHIGLRNNTLGHVNHSGIWADGAFSWFDADDWQRTMVYESDTLVTQVTLVNPKLQVTIYVTDVVDFDRDMLIRKMRVVNNGPEREIRLFFHHDWHIEESEGGNTVYYQPDLRALVAYKDRFYLFVAGITGDASVGGPAAKRTNATEMNQWATGYKEFNGQLGTWKDAEDGELGRNPIAQGSVDSCAGFTLGRVAAGGEAYSYHWVVAGQDFNSVTDDHQMIIDRGPELFIKRTRDYWRLWVETKPLALDCCDLPQPLIDLYRRSLLIIRTQIDDDGAIIAATDGDVWNFARDSYCYMWPRDGALVADVLSHAGYGDITSDFFHFCANVLTREGYLLHKFTPEGALGSSWHPWMGPNGRRQLPIQEDETALVVYALGQHYRLFHEVEFVKPLYRPLVKSAADFMVAFREPHTNLPHPSWDLWEERYGIHSYTVAAVYAGLTAAAMFTAVFGETDISAKYTQAAEEIKTATRKYLWSDSAGRFVRTIHVDSTGNVQQDMTIDASISGLYQFGMFDATSDEMRKTMQAVKDHLTVKTSVGGVARYENDYYHQVSQDIANVPGNPWFICACWLAEFEIAQATTVQELHSALGWLEWVRQHALASGVLAEQVNPYTGAPLSVSPLTWSHAEYAGAIRWYVGKYVRLTQSAHATNPLYAIPAADPTTPVNPMTPAATLS
jgi:GH15 family glucan-1,4-alpha-glucosidase